MNETAGQYGGPDTTGNFEGNRYENLLFYNNPLPMWVYALETFQFLAVNHAAVSHYGYSMDEFKSMTIQAIRPLEDIPRLIDNVKNVTEGVDKAGLWRHKKKDGTLIDVEIISHTLEFAGQRAELVVAIDVTERVKAENTLRDSEDRFRTYIQYATDFIFTLDHRGRITSANLAMCELLGFTEQELRDKPALELVVPEMKDEAAQALGRIWRGESVDVIEVSVQTRDGRRRVVQIRGRALHKAGKFIETLHIARDITAQKQAEEDLKNSEQRYRAIFNGVQDAIFVESIDGRILAINDRACEMFGYARPDFLTKTVADLVPAGYPLWKVNPASDVFLSTPLETINIRSNGEHFPVELTGRAEIINNEEALLVIVRDITERKQAEQRLRLQLERLQSLRMIDMTISSSFDMGLTLNVILEQIVLRLRVDAADFLLLNTATQTLGFAAGRGFHSRAIQHTRLQLGEGYAGRAALERQTIHVPDVMRAGGNLAQALLLEQESFVAYFGVPLIAKRHVKGVLEIFQRTPLAPDPDWLNFLETLAGQAAIAIDDAQLFDGLQRSNTNLMLAYDATIEGWSRAMDLRDKETEGHTRRVTELTMQLAQAAGMSHDELAHVRRGALLHDMGKLGIPDSILLKTDKLTDEEWVIMRQHPQYAYDMLSSIEFLRPALDIPYCHHEKWDGSGYPQGLAGEDIPLQARLFAIVDVWDALRSDRPYRAGWSQAKALGYIRDQVKIHFDPKVVDLFFQLIQ